MQKSSNEAFKSPFVCQCPAPCTFLFCVAFAFSQIWGGKTFLINLTSILSDVSLVSFLVCECRTWEVEWTEMRSASLCWYFCLPSEQNETQSFCLQSQLSCNFRHWSAVSCRTGLFFSFFFGWTIGCLLEIKPCRICSFKVAMESFFTYCRYHLSWAAL